MKAFLFLDFLLLKQFQKFSVWFQKLTGITCFQLAKFFAKISFIFATLSYICGFFINKPLFILVLNSICWLWWSFGFWRFSIFCEVLDEKYSSNNSNFGNDLMLHPSFVGFRVLLLFFVVLYTGLFLAMVFSNTYLLDELLFYVGVTAALFCAYFVVCTPLATKSK